MREGWRKDWYFVRIGTCGSLGLQHQLLMLMRKVWTAGSVVKDWKDAEIVPIPKKGDFQHCEGNQFVRCSWKVIWTYTAR